MNRINIIGPPGSGKTTLSRKLSQLNSLPIIHMDNWGVEGKYNALNNKPLFTKKIAQECEKEKWIMEGVYKSTLVNRMPRAELTIFLDFPRRICIYRILKRRIAYHNKQREEMSANWKERINWVFFFFSWNFNKKERPKIKSELEKYPNQKIITLKSPKEVKNYLKSHKTGE